MMRLLLAGCLLFGVSYADGLILESDPYKLLLQRPGKTEVNQRLVQAFDCCKKEDEAGAVALLEPVLAEKTSSIEQRAFACLFLSQLFQRQKKATEAGQALAAGIALFGSSQEALAHSWMTLAQMSAACAQPQEAAHAWLQAASLKPLSQDKHAYFMLELGRAQIRAGDGKSAVKTLTELAETEGLPHEKEFAAILERANALTLLGDHEASFRDYALLTNWIEMPDHLRAKAFLSRSVLYTTLKDPDHAIADITKILDSMPAAEADDRASARYNRASLWLQQGKEKEALAEYLAVTHVSEASPKIRAYAFTKIADAHVRADRRDDAVKELSKAAALPELAGDTLAFVLVKRGIQNAYGHHSEAAIQDFTTVLATPEAEVSSISESLYARGTVLLADHRNDEAAADFTRATQLKGLPPERLGKIWLKLSSLYEKTGRTNEMLTTLAKSADVPGVADTHIALTLGYRALKLMEAGSNKEAVTDLDRVIALKEIPPVTRMRSRALRGFAYIKLKDNTQALSDLDAVIACPDYLEKALPEVLSKRALILDELKRSDEADADRKRARLINEKHLKK